MVKKTDIQKLLNEAEVERKDVKKFEAEGNTSLVLKAGEVYIDTIKELLKASIEWASKNKSEAIVEGLEAYDVEIKGLSDFYKAIQVEGFVKTMIN